MPPAAQVFISYSSHDRGFVRRLVEALELRKVTVTYDERVLIGEDSEQALRAMRRNARFTIAVMSPSYFKSAYTRDEWEEALRRESSEGRVVLLPVLAELIEPPEALRLKRS